MTHTLPLFTATIESSPAAAWARRLRWWTWAGVIAAAGCAGVAMAGLPLLARLQASAEPPGMATARETPSAADRALLPTVPEGAGRARLRSRCEGCGVVETIRHVEPSGTVPAEYEFTVRLRDGTTRTSSDPSPARWHTGDSIMLIGGVKPPVQ